MTSSELNSIAIAVRCLLGGAFLEVVETSHEHLLYRDSFYFEAFCRFGCLFVEQGREKLLKA